MLAKQRGKEDDRYATLPVVEKNKTRREALLRKIISFNCNIERVKSIVIEASWCQSQIDEREAIHRLVFEPAAWPPV